MEYVNHGGYNINLDHAKEIKSLSELKKDKRFFHQHEGKERDDLCENFFNQYINIPKIQNDVTGKPEQFDSEFRNI